jgi:hypothetical protein
MLFTVHRALSRTFPYPGSPRLPRRLQFRQATLCRLRLIVERLEDRTLLSGAPLGPAYGQVPLSFEPNVGQTNSQVSFLSHGSGYTLFLSPREAVLSLQPVHAGSSSASAAASQAPSALRMELVGANPAAAATGLERQANVSNYFLGNNPSQWYTNVPNYAQVQYQGVYRGVDVVYYGNQRQLEYDFRVAPGANPSDIQLRFSGTQGISLDRAGDLVLHTAGGDIVEHAPILYQQGNGVRHAVAGSYVLEANGQVGFQVGPYDPAQELIIDPVLSYSTYLGGSGTDFGVGLAVDSAGNAYVSGGTTSTNFPIVGGVQTSMGSATLVAFVAKLNAAGTALVYSTYLGGNASTDGFKIAVDSAGDAYVTGYTTSTNFPTVNPIQSSLAGTQNAFLTKLNATGSALVYSTYLGGNGSDWALGITLDGADNVYLSGQTTSTNFPTVNPIQSSYAGSQDAFVTKVNAAGSALVYSTYLGGNAQDSGPGIAVDSTGAMYISGSTNSTNFPTANAIQPTYGGLGDAFVTKLSPSGNALVYSTYLGGSNFDGGAAGIAVDSAGAAYVAGNTFSTNFPTVNAFQSTFTGDQDTFITKVNAAGTALVYSTYLGGNHTVQPGVGGLAVDGAGDAYVGGLTNSTDLPTVNPIQATYGGGSRDGFISELNAAGTALAFSTFLGGSGDDFDPALAPDSSGNLYVTGNTLSTNFPTANPLQVHNAGGEDAFISKITIGNPVPAITSLSSTSANEGSADLTLTLTGSGFIASSVVNWNGAALTTTYVSSTQLQAIIPAAELADEGSDTITVVNPAPGGGTSNALSFTVTPVPPTAGISGPTDGYQGVQGQTRTFTLTATSPSSTDQAAGFTYTVQWGDGQSTTTAAGQSGSGTNVSHVYAVAGSYTISVTATDDDGQISTAATLTDTILVAEQQGNTLMVGGTAGNDTFVFTPGSTAGSLRLAVNGTNVGTFTPPGPVAVSGYAGSNKVTVNGTRGNDSFVLGSGSVALNGLVISGTGVNGWTLNGQGGSDTLTGPDATETWTVSAAGGGKAGTYSFRGFTNLVGGSGNDTFKFSGSGSVPGTLDGGTGINKLDYSGDGGVSIAVNLATDSASRIDGAAAGGFQHIQSLAGSTSSSDTLTGPNATTLWTISGINAGKAGSFAFTGIEKLVGGTGLDTFKLGSASARVTSMDGGGAPSAQGDWLDCSAFTATVSVTIDLNAGQVRWTVGTTNVTVSLANIQNAVGGAGNDTLVGNSLGNILIGRAGNDTITGGTGRSVLIGDNGSDTITDGSGSDILISGTTTYDKNKTALMEILAEWQRTDENYTQRVADLKNGGGLNGSYKLIWGSTVKDDGTQDVLNGAVGGLDWFFANLAQDTINNQNGNEQVD